MVRRKLHCSFCGKDETQVLKLVAGPNVYICDACVATARNIMDNSKDDDDVTQKVSLPRWRRLLARILQIVNVQRRVDGMLSNDAFENGLSQASLRSLARAIQRGR